jgi:hypothetical protein
MYIFCLYLRPIKLAIFVFAHNKAITRIVKLASTEKMKKCSVKWGKSNIASLFCFSDKGVMHGTRGYNG